MDTLSQSACPWQDFPAYYSVCEQGWSQPERSTFQVLHFKVGSWVLPKNIQFLGACLTFSCETGAQI